jgi:hypothetical protein
MQDGPPQENCDCLPLIFAMAKVYQERPICVYGDSISGLWQNLRMLE